MSDLNKNSKQLHVVHLLSGDNEIWGGVENYVHNLATANNMGTVRTSVVCTAAGVISEKFSKSNFDVHILPIDGYFDFQSIFKLADLLQAHNIDLVHAHLGLDSFVGAFAAKLARKPIVLSVHFDQPNYMSYNALPRNLWRAAQKLKNQLVAHFLPITENVARELIRRESVPEEKITIVYPGITPHVVPEFSREVLRQSLGCNAQNLIVVAVGRLEEEKNFACLIEAVAALNNENVHCWIVGEGSQRQNLNGLINDHRLASRVKLLGYRQDVPALLHAADIFVLPSRAEAFGMAVAEAMVARLPVVSTLVPGPKMIVQHNVTGLLVKPDDCEALTNALSKLLNDDGLRSRFARAGYERALSLFTSDAMSRKVMKVYHDVFNKLGNSSA